MIGEGIVNYLCKSSKPRFKPLHIAALSPQLVAIFLLTEPALLDGLFGKLENFQVISSTILLFDFEEKKVRHLIPYEKKN